MVTTTAGTLGGQARQNDKQHSYSWGAGWRGTAGPVLFCIYRICKCGQQRPRPATIETHWRPGPASDANYFHLSYHHGHSHRLGHLGSIGTPRLPPHPVITLSAPCSPSQRNSRQAEGVGGVS